MLFKKISVYSKDDPENNMTEYRVIKETLYKKSAKTDVLFSLWIALASVNIYVTLHLSAFLILKYCFLGINFIVIISNILMILKKPYLGSPKIIEVYNEDTELDH